MQLEVCNLKFCYEKTDILKNVSFSAKSGELVFLLGPNGAGKTTLFRCILGILKKYSGNIKIDGKNISKYTVRELAGKIAYIPQTYDATFSYSVLDIVLMGGAHNISAFSSPNEKTQARALDILGHLGIRELALKCFAKLSGGEQQLVMVARALMQSAGILLMDEPTSSLDYGNQLRLLQKVKELVGENYLILLSSHNPQHALSYADRILAVHAGEIIADGRPCEILDKSLFTRLYGTEVDFVDTDRGRLIAPVRYVTASFTWNTDRIRFMKDASEYGDYYQKLARLLSKYIPEDAGVCDAGCGLGYLSTELTNHCEHVTAIDISDDALDVLRQNVRKIREDEETCLKESKRNSIGKEETQSEGRKRSVGSEEVQSEGRKRRSVGSEEVQSEDTKRRSVGSEEVQSEDTKRRSVGKYTTIFSKLTVIRADMEKLTAEEIKQKNGHYDGFDCMIFNFFGDTLRCLKIAKRLCKKNGKVILIKKDWYKHRFSLSEKTIEHYTLEETMSKLQELGIRAELHRQELDMGQPFRSVEDTFTFFKIYNHEDRAVRQAKAEQYVAEAKIRSSVTPEQYVAEAKIRSSVTPEQYVAEAKIRSSVTPDQYVAEAKIENPATLEQSVEKVGTGNPSKIRYSAEEAILGRLVKTGDSEFPYYLPQKKAIGIFVIEADDIPDNLYPRGN